MLLLDYAKGFQRLANLRFNRLSDRYTEIVDGQLRNKGYERDNILDILEEAADAQNILDIRVGRCDGKMSLEQFEAFKEIAQGIAQVVAGCYRLDMNQDSEIFCRENVERAVSREEMFEVD